MSNSKLVNYTKLSPNALLKLSEIFFRTQLVRQAVTPESAMTAECCFVLMRAIALGVHQAMQMIRGQSQSNVQATR